MATAVGLIRSLKPTKLTRFLLASLPFLFSVLLAAAQSSPLSVSVQTRTVSVRLIVTDANQQPVAGATGRLALHSDLTQTANRPVELVITDTAGVATVTPQPDAPDELRLTAVGTKPLIKAIKPKATQTTFRFRLDAVTTDLMAVTVTARKPSCGRKAT